jgi:magnesium transporter
MQKHVEITREFILELNEIIERKDEKAAINLLSGLHPADIAEIFELLSMEEVIFLFLLLDPETSADVIAEVEEDDRERLLRALPSEVIAKQILDKMESDDAADLLGDMDEHRQEEVLSQMEDVEQAGDIVDLLNYGENTAGGLMAKEYIKVRENWTVDQCIKEIRRQVEEVEEVYFVYVVDDDDKLLGILSLKTLIISPSNKKAINLCEKDILSVKTDMNAEDVANIMQKYDLVAVPVVDSIGRLVGRITIDDVVDVIRDEAEKDYQLISGITEDVESEDRLWVQSRARLPWLLIGLLGGIMGALVIRSFDAEFDLEPFKPLVWFLPLIAAMAGNVGVQSSSIVVQGIASKTLNISGTGRRLLRELGVGLANGLILAALMLLFNLAMKNSNFLTLTVSLSLLAVVIFASGFGALVPLLLHRFKIDPALATGPFITTSNDIFGLLTYLFMAKLLFGVFGVA